MLVGVLCEVVSAVAAMEKEELLVNSVMSKMHRIVADLDQNGSGTLSKHELKALLDHPEAARTLHDVGVDVVGLVDFADFIFQNLDLDEDDEDDEPEQRELSFADFMDVVLQFRGTNTATVKDMVDLRKFVQQVLSQTNARVLQIMEKLDMFQAHNKAPRDSFRKSRMSRAHVSGPGVSSLPLDDGSSGARFSLVDDGAAEDDGDNFVVAKKSSMGSYRSARPSIFFVDDRPACAEEDEDNGELAEGIPEELSGAFQNLQDLASRLDDALGSRLDVLRQQWRRPTPTCRPDPGDGGATLPDSSDRKIEAVAAAAAAAAIEGRMRTLPAQWRGVRAAGEEEDEEEEAPAHDKGGAGDNGHQLGASLPRRPRRPPPTKAGSGGEAEVESNAEDKLASGRWLW
mmetsp:Transcript_9375/g.23308  ORF Transcript_9375/g.23308 Transcript_9375/m.23308 type:complete len:400 (-) Transcript_9375:65-1264(-)